MSRGSPRSKREWNLIIDKRWYARLNLRDGDRLPASDFVRRLQEAIREGIDDIYREIPPEMTSRRLEHLKAGMAKFLEQG